MAASAKTFLHFALLRSEDGVVIVALDLLKSIALWTKDLFKRKQNYMACEGNPSKNHSSDRMRGKGLKLHQGRFRKNFFIKGKFQLNTGTGCPGEDGSPSLGGFKRGVDVPLRDMFLWWLWQMSGLWLDSGLKGLFQQFFDSVKENEAKWSLQMDVPDTEAATGVQRWHSTSALSLNAAVHNRVMCRRCWHCNWPALVWTLLSVPGGHS